MDLSHFLAKFLGSYMLIMAAIWLIRKDQFGITVRNIMGSDNTYSMTAIIQIIFGLLIVISHSVWTMDWRVLITLIGYLALAVGVVRLAFPEETKSYFLDAAERGYWIMMGILVVLGGTLAYNGFIGG
jgi:uncharacterized membrane protein